MAAPGKNKQKKTKKKKVKITTKPPIVWSQEKCRTYRKHYHRFQTHLKIQVTENTVAKTIINSTITWFSTIKKEVDADVVLYPWDNNSTDPPLYTADDFPNTIQALRTYFNGVRPGRGKTFFVFCRTHVGMNKFDPTVKIQSGVDSAIAAHYESTGDKCFAKVLKISDSPHEISDLQYSRNFTMPTLSESK